MRRISPEDFAKVKIYLARHTQYDDLEGAKISDKSVREIITLMRGKKQWRVFPDHGTGLFKFGERRKKR